MEQGALIAAVNALILKIDAVSIMLGMDPNVPYDFDLLRAQADDALAAAKREVRESADSGYPEVQALMEQLNKHYSRVVHEILAAKMGERNAARLREAAIAREGHETD